MIFKNDVFVSYALPDDTGQPAGLGWVSQFVQHLRAALAPGIGERTEVFFDAEMVRNADKLTFVLQNARQSAVFVPILSPSYLARDFPFSELAWFCSQGVATGTIFPVELLPINYPALPPVLSEGRRVRFWSRDRDSGRAKQLAPSDRSYADALQTLSSPITRKLTETVGQSEMRKKAATLRREPWDVFLSHAGEDHELASRTATGVKSAFARRGRELNVLNTSTSSDRFYELQQAYREPSIERFEQELREYLESSMTRSRAYVLLVTRQSLGKNSKWIAFEIATARQIAAGRPNFFISCVSGVKLTEIPAAAADFPGVDIASDRGLGALIDCLSEGALRN